MGELGLHRPLEGSRDKVDVTYVLWRGIGLRQLEKEYVKWKKIEAGNDLTKFNKIAISLIEPPSPYLFDMILDVLGRGIKEKPPGVGLMLFADDIVLCSTRREHA